MFPRVERILEMTAETEQAEEVAIELHHTLHEGLADNNYDIEADSQLDSVSRHLSVEPPRATKNYWSRLRLTEVEYANFIKLTLAKTPLTEEDFQKITNVLLGSLKLKTLDWIMNYPAIFLRPLTGYFSQVGNLAETIPLVCLQILCYAIENGQLKVIQETILQHPDKCADGFLFQQFYQRAIEKENSISPCAAIALCHLMDSQHPLPAKAETILCNMLTQTSRLEAKAVARPFNNELELNVMQTRLRALKALTVAVMKGHRIKELTFNIVKKFLHQVQQERRFFFDITTFQHVAKAGKCSYWQWKSTYKKDALNGKKFSIGEFSYIYRYIIENQNIDCIWALFYAAAWNKQMLPAADKKYTLQKVSRQLKELLTIPLKHQNNPEHQELKFAAACMLCALPQAVVPLADLKAAISIVLSEFRNESHHDHARQQDIAIIAMALIQEMYLHNMDDELSLINACFDPLRIEAAILVSEFIETQAPREGSQTGYVPPIEKEVVTALEFLMKSDAIGVADAAARALNSIQFYQQHYSQFTFDISDLKQNLLNPARSYRASQIIMGSVQNKRGINNIIFEALKTALLDKRIDEPTKSNIVYIFAYIIKNSLENDMTEHPDISYEILDYLSDRVTAFPAADNNSFALYQYARGMSQNGKRYHLENLIKLFPKFNKILSHEHCSDLTKENCLRIIIQCVHKGGAVHAELNAVLIQLIKDDKLMKFVLTLLSLLTKKENVDFFSHELIICLIDKLCDKDKQTAENVCQVLFQYIENPACRINHDLIYAFINLLLVEPAFYYIKMLLVEIIITRQHFVDKRTLQAMLDAASNFNDIEISNFSAALLVHAVQISHVDNEIFERLQALLWEAAENGMKEVSNHCFNAVNAAYRKNQAYIISQLTYDALCHLLQTSNLDAAYLGDIFKLYELNAHHLLKIPVDTLCNIINEADEYAAIQCVNALIRLFHETNASLNIPDEFVQKLNKQLIKSIFHPHLKLPILQLLSKITAFGNYDFYTVEICHFCHDLLFHEQEKKALNHGYRILKNFEAKKMLPSSVESAYKQEKAARINIKKDTINSQLISQLARSAKQGQKLTNTTLRYIAKAAGLPKDRKQLEQLLRLIKIVVKNGQIILHSIYSFLHEELQKKSNINDVIDIIRYALENQEQLTCEMMLDIENTFLECHSEAMFAILKIQIVRGAKLNEKTIETLIGMINRSKQNTSALQQAAFILAFCKNEPDLFKKVKVPVLIKDLFALLKRDEYANIHEDLLSILERLSVDHTLSPVQHALVEMKKLMFSYYKSDIDNKIKQLEHLKNLNLDEKFPNLVSEIVVSALKSKIESLILAVSQLLLAKKRLFLLSDDIFKSMLDLMPNEVSDELISHLLAILKEVSFKDDKIPLALKNSCMDKVKFIFSGTSNHALLELALQVFQRINQGFIADNAEMGKEYAQNNIIIHLFENKKLEVNQTTGEIIVDLTTQGWALHRFEGQLMNLLAQEITAPYMLKACLMMLQNGHVLSDDLIKKLILFCTQDSQNDAPLIMQFLFQLFSQHQLQFFTEPQDVKSMLLCRVRGIVETSLCHETACQGLHILNYFASEEKEAQLILDEEEEKLYNDIPCSYLETMILTHYLRVDSTCFEAHNKLLMYMMNVVKKYHKHSFSTCITNETLLKLYDDIVNDQKLTETDIECWIFLLLFHAIIQSCQGQLSIEAMSLSVGELALHFNKIAEKDFILFCMPLLARMADKFQFTSYEFCHILFYFKTQPEYFYRQLNLNLTEKNNYINQVRILWMQSHFPVLCKENVNAENGFYQKLFKKINDHINHCDIYFVYIEKLFFLIDSSNETSQRNDLAELEKIMALYREENDLRKRELIEVIIEKNSINQIKKNVSELYQFIETVMILEECRIIPDELDSDKLILLEQYCDMISALFALGWTRNNLTLINHHLLKNDNLEEFDREILFKRFYQLMINYKITAHHAKDIINAAEKKKDEILKSLHDLAVKINFEGGAQEKTVPELLAEFKDKNPDFSPDPNFLHLLENATKIARDEIKVEAVPALNRANAYLVLSCWAKKMKKQFQSGQTLTPEQQVELYAVMSKAIKFHTSKNELFGKDGFSLRPAQILAINALIENGNMNRLGELGTGEGKSVIIAVIAAIKALQGRRVDICISSPILAERDASVFKDFFALFDLKVDHNIDHDMKQANQKDLKKCYADDVHIIYGETGQFQFDLLRHEFKQLGTRGNRPFDYIIVDEADSSMLDQAGNIARLSEIIPAFDHLSPVYSIIWYHLDLILAAYKKLSVLEKEEQSELLKEQHVAHREILERLLKIRDKDTFDAELKVFLHEKLLDLIELDSNAEYKTENQKMLLPVHLHELVRSQLNVWIDSALYSKIYLCLRWQYDILTDQEDVKRVVPVDYLFTGVTQRNTQWSDGVHQFLQLKEKVPLTPQSLTTNFISNIAFFKRYKNLIGLTGTLGCENSKQLLQVLYKPLDCVLLPSFRRKRFVLFKPTLVDNQSAWLSTIVQRATQETSFGRAVLIICESIEDVSQLYEKMKLVHSPLNIKCYSSSESKVNIVDDQIDSAQIIIATNLAARGTDLVPTAKVNQQGGLHFIGTSLCINSRVFNQGIGRTSRTGSPGTAEIIVMSGSNNVTFQELEEKRDALEARRLAAFEKEELPNIQHSTALFEAFCELLQLVSETIDRKQGRDGCDFANNKMNDIHKKMLCASTIERWGIWFKSVNLNHEPMQAFAEFKAEIIADLENGQLIRNPCYLLQEANQLIAYSESWKHTLTQLGVYRSIFHKTIMARCDAVKDPLFLAQASTISAFAVLRNEEPECKVTARKKFTDAIALTHGVIVPQLVCVKNLVQEHRTDEGLVKQLTGKISIYSAMVNSCERAIRAIDRSRKIITLMQSGKNIASGTINDLLTYLKENELDDKQIELEFMALRIVYDLGSKLRSEPINLIEKAYKINHQVGVDIKFSHLPSLAATEILALIEAIAPCVTVVRNQLTLNEIKSCLQKYELTNTMGLVISQIPKQGLEKLNVILSAWQLPLIQDGKTRLVIKCSENNAILGLLEAMERLIAEEPIIFCAHEMRFDVTLNRLKLAQAKVEVDQFDTTFSIILHVANKKKGIEIAEKLYQKINEATIGIKLLSKAQYGKLLQGIKIEEETLEKIRIRDILTVFTDAYQRREVAQLRANGLSYFYELNEKIPFRLYSTLLLGSIAIAEVTAGLAIAICFASSGAGLSLGIGLVCEGVGDVFELVKLGVTHDINWTAFMVTKACSLTLMVGTAGLASLYAAKGVVQVGKEIGQKTLTSIGTEIAEHATTEIVEVGIKTTITQVGRSALSSSLQTVGLEVLKKTISETVLLAEEMTSKAILSDNFFRFEHAIKQEIHRTIALKTQHWNLKLPHIFANIHFLEIKGIDHRMARELERISETVLSTHDSLLNKIKAASSLFNIVGMIEPLMKAYMEQLDHHIQGYYEKVTLSQAFKHLANVHVDDKKWQLINKHLKKIESFLKASRILTKDGYLCENIAFSKPDVTPDFSKVSIQPVYMTDLSFAEELLDCRELIIESCLAMHEYLYGSKQAQVAHSIDVYKETAGKALTERAMVYVFNLIQSVQSAAFSILNAASTSFIPSAPAAPVPLSGTLLQMLLSKTVEQCKQATLLYLGVQEPTLGVKWMRLNQERLSLIRMEGIINGKLEHVSVTDQLKSTASAEQEQKMVEYFGISFSDLSTAAWSLLDDHFIEDNLDQLFKIIGNEHTTAKERSIAIMLLIYNVLRCLPDIFSARGELRNIRLQTKRHILSVLEKEQIWHILRENAHTIPAMPTQIYYFLQDNSLSRLSSLFSNQRDQYIALILREMLPDGYFVKETLAFIATLFKHEYFGLKAREMLAALSNPIELQSAFLNFLFMEILPGQSVASALYQFAGQKGFVYAKRTLSDYPSTLAEYDLNDDDDLKLIIEWVNAMIIYPFSFTADYACTLMQVYQYYKDNHYVEAAEKFIENMAGNTALHEFLTSQKQAAVIVLIVKVFNRLFPHLAAYQTIIENILKSEVLPFLIFLTTVPREVAFREKRSYIEWIPGYIHVLSGRNAADNINLPILLQMMVNHPDESKAVMLAYIFKRYMDMLTPLMTMISNIPGIKPLLSNHGQIILNCLQTLVFSSPAFKAKFLDIEFSEPCQAVITNEEIYLLYDHYQQRNWLTLLKSLKHFSPLLRLSAIAGFHYYIRPKLATVETIDSPEALKFVVPVNGFLKYIKIIGRPQVITLQKSFTSIRWLHVTLENVLIVDSVFKQVSFENVRCLDVTLQNVIMDAASFVNFLPILREPTNRIHFRNLMIEGDLSHVDLSNLDLEGINFANVSSLQGANVNSAVMPVSGFAHDMQRQALLVNTFGFLRSSSRNLDDENIKKRNRFLVDTVVSLVVTQAFLGNDKMTQIEIQALQEALSLLLNTIDVPDYSTAKKIALCAHKFLGDNPADLSANIIGVAALCGFSEDLNEVSKTALLLKAIFDHRKEPEKLPWMVTAMVIGFHVERMLFPGFVIRGSDRLRIYHEVIDTLSMVVLDELVTDGLPYAKCVADALKGELCFDWYNGFLALLGNIPETAMSYLPKTPRC